MYQKRCGDRTTILPNDTKFSILAKRLKDRKEKPLGINGRSQVSHVHRKNRIKLGQQGNTTELNVQPLFTRFFDLTSQLALEASQQLIRCCGQRKSHVHFVRSFLRQSRVIQSDLVPQLKVLHIQPIRHRNRLVDQLGCNRWIIRPDTSRIQIRKRDQKATKERTTNMEQRENSLQAIFRIYGC
jgi:hypothetical protein